MSDILDQGLKEPQRWPNYADWTLVGCLSDAQMAWALQALEQAEIRWMELVKQWPSMNQTGIVPSTIQQMGGLKTLVYVDPAQAAQAEAILREVPLPLDANRAADQAAQQFWIRLVWGFIAVVVLALWANLLLGDPLGLAYDGFECYNCNHFIIRCLLGI